ncbi:MAG: BON domain-containing protein [Desulfuromonadales bacterium]|nr:BON domain-containing protein [Desulfuromonadales bacterium]
MKSFIIGLFMGAIIASCAIWYFTAGSTMPAVQKAEERAATKAGETLDSLQSAGEKAKLALTAKFEALDLRSEDIQKELAEKGNVVRRKAREVGGAAVDATHDARVTTVIKAKLAADSDLSAISISVATTAGRVTLSGTVTSPELIGKAMTLALETDGVREVVSTIQIKK